MTQYVATVQGGSQLQIKAGANFDVRLIRAELFTFAFNGASSSVSVDKRVGSPTLTSGTTITPAVTREGPAAPAAEATVKSGATLGGSYTTYNFFFSQDVSSDGTTDATSLNTSYTPPADVILRAGSSSILTFTVGYSVTVYFEELRLFWSV
jgi:hypothetical protein